MNRLSIEKRAQLVHLLVEGNSIRATSRISGIGFATVIKFVADIEQATALNSAANLPLDKFVPRASCVRKIIASGGIVAFLTGFQNDR